MPLPYRGLQANLQAIGGWLEEGIIMVHIGERYNIRVLRTTKTTYDRWGSSKTRQNVLIYDKYTDKLYQYVGRGQDLGNFHPIYITVPQHGTYSLESLLHTTDNRFPVRGHKLNQPGIIVATMVDGFERSV